MCTKFVLRQVAGIRRSYRYLIPPEMWVYSQVGHILGMNVSKVMVVVFEPFSCMNIHWRWVVWFGRMLRRPKFVGYVSARSFQLSLSPSHPPLLFPHLSLSLPQSLLLSSHPPPLHSSLQPRGHRSRNTFLALQRWAFLFFKWWLRSGRGSFMCRWTPPPSPSHSPSQRIYLLKTSLCFDTSHTWHLSHLAYVYTK